MVTLTDATPMIAPAFTLLAFTIVIVGGMGSMTGALVGGLLIGIVEALASVLVAPSMKTMVSFALLVAVLALRPQGLMGRRG
jgi:branched-chain amino acid transport system permease protein